MQTGNRDFALARHPLPTFLLNWAKQQDISMLFDSKKTVYELAYHNNKLYLHWLGSENFSPVFVEMPNTGRIAGSNLLLKAMGKKTKSVIDLTAGLGLDALTLASVGKKVYCVERCAPVALLLYDGVIRCSNFVGNNVDLIFADSREWLANSKPEFDTLYIDTMFFAKKKTAKPPKTMQILRLLAGDDEDVELLINQAFKSGAKRIVIKNHDNGPPLRAEPDMQYRGKTVRFDVYVS